MISKAELPMGIGSYQIAPELDNEVLAPDGTVMEPNRSLINSFAIIRAAALDAYGGVDA